MHRAFLRAERAPVACSTCQRLSFRSVRLGLALEGNSVTVLGAFLDITRVVNLNNVEP